MLSTPLYRWGWKTSLQVVGGEAATRVKFFLITKPTFYWRASLATHGPTHKQQLDPRIRHWQGRCLGSDSVQMGAGSEKGARSLAWSDWEGLTEELPGGGNSCESNIEKRLKSSLAYNGISKTVWRVIFTRKHIKLSQAFILRPKQTMGPFVASNMLNPIGSNHCLTFTSALPIWQPYQSSWVALKLCLCHLRGKPVIPSHLSRIFPPFYRDLCLIATSWRGIPKFFM